MAAEALVSELRTKQVELDRALREKQIKLSSMEEDSIDVNMELDSLRELVQKRQAHKTENVSVTEEENHKEAKKIENVEEKEHHKSRTVNDTEEKQHQLLEPLQKVNVAEEHEHQQVQNVSDSEEQDQKTRLLAHDEEVNSNEERDQKLQLLAQRKKVSDDEKEHHKSRTVNDTEEKQHQLLEPLQKVNVPEEHEHRQVQNVRDNEEQDQKMRLLAHDEEVNNNEERDQKLQLLAQRKKVSDDEKVIVPEVGDREQSQKVNDAGEELQHLPDQARIASAEDDEDQQQLHQQEPKVKAHQQMHEKAQNINAIKDQNQLLYPKVSGTKEEHDLLLAKAPIVSESEDKEVDNQDREISNKGNWPGPLTRESTLPLDSSVTDGELPSSKAEEEKIYPEDLEGMKQSRRSRGKKTKGERRNRGGGTSVPPPGKEDDDEGKISHKLDSMREMSLKKRQAPLEAKPSELDGETFKRG